MIKNSSKSLALTVGIVLLLSVLLMKRLFIRSYSMDSTLSFLAGFAVIFLGYLILRVVLKNKK
jgi:hypothetical protein